MRDEDRLMPMCYCCTLPTGLHFVNGILVALCLMDSMVDHAYKTANMHLGSALGIPSGGQMIVVWVYTIVTILVGTTGLKMPPSKNKGMCLKAWRFLLMGFMIVWTVRMGMNIKELNQWAWDREENKPKKLENGEDRERSMFQEKVFAFIESSFRWYVYSTMSFPESWAFFSIKYWGILVYFGVIIPFAFIFQALGYIKMYLAVTNNGELDLITGLLRRRDLRKQKQQERVALLGGAARLWGESPEATEEPQDPQPEEPQPHEEPVNN